MLRIRYRLLPIIGIILFIGCPKVVHMGNYDAVRYKNAYDQLALEQNECMNMSKYYYEELQECLQYFR